MAFFSRKSKPAATTSPPGARAPSDPAADSPVRPRAADATLEPRIAELGNDMLRRARGHKLGLLSARFYSDKLMDWSMRDHAFKVQLFRFVDAFPVLRTSDDIYDHLLDYLSQPGLKLPPGLDLGLKAGGLARGLAVSAISSQITSMAGKFIAGTDAASALGNLERLWKDGIAFSVDLLGEACLSDAEADAYRDKYLDLITNLPARVASWKPQARLESDHAGAIPRTNVSVKISSLSARCDPIDTDGSIRDLMHRLTPILEAARRQGVFVNFDMEQFALKDLTIRLFQQCCEQFETGSPGGLHAGLAMQAYLRSGPDDAAQLAEWARRSGRTVTVRLVKGAYWDYEVIHSEQMGWPCPVWTTKRDTDACFERMTAILLDSAPRASLQPGVKLALGSHNVRSIAAALAMLEQRAIPRNALEIQMLHGMADQLKGAAAEMDLRVREYVPVGQMIPGMAYLVRRLLENTSNESWLRAGFLDNADPGILLASPHAAPAAHATGSANGTAHAHPGSPAIDPDDRRAPERHTLTPAVRAVGDGRPFINEAFRDFSRAGVRQAFADAVARAAVPAVASDTTPEAASAMVERARAAFLDWRDTDPRVRAGVLTAAAEAMRRRRDELAGIIIKEAAKPWREADADVCEAIDFCEYYARLAVPLFEPQRLGRFIGELNEFWYQPRGVAVVIAPWNFPLAICCGMTVAALVTGNTAIIKPAEQTPGIARVLFDILADALRRAQAPAHTLQFCPAPGETTGAALVRDPRVDLVAFTGSMAVGLDILHGAAPPSPFESGPDVCRTGALTHVKRVVCEMGGKNALIVDTSADPDESVLAVRQSAFGYQGQKCSACSRCIVVDREGPSGAAITHFASRLVEASRALVVGDPARPGTDLGPVIDEAAARKIRGFIERARAAGLRVEQMAIDEGDPFIARHRARVVPPTIVLGVPPDHELACEEIFGPVLAIIHAKSFDHALEIANASVYKLTGGVLSRRPSHLARARRELRVGNLYLNRGITGALVGRQPFGGFGMSGVGSKAGGPDYLLQFVEPRAACENMMRRGFAPEL